MEVDAKSEGGDDLIKKLIIEHRPILGSVSFYVQFNDDIPIDFKITPHRDCVELGSRKINFSSYFNVDPSRSVSISNIGERELSFRMETIESNLIKKVQMTALNDEKLWKVIIVKEKDYQIQCRNCETLLTGVIRFDRVLELPSENLDVDDMFCHKHHHANDGEDIEEEKLEVQPKKFDFLFGNFCSLLSLEIFNENLIESNRFLYCRGCTSILGEQAKEKSGKFWSDTVEMKTGRLNFFSVTNLTEIFQLTIRNAITTQIKFGLDISIPIILRILVETPTKRSILLKIMDPNLNVFKIDSNLTLLRLNTAKILMREPQQPNDEELKNWKIDSDVTTIEVSPNVLNAGIKMFEENSLNVGEVFRVINGYLVTYLECSN